MLLTGPLLSKSSFFGSFINKVRQVISNKPTKSDQKKHANKTSFIPYINEQQKTTSQPLSQSLTDHEIFNDVNNRPAAVANISISSPLTAASQGRTPSKTYEEQVGLPPRPKKPLTPYFRFMREMRPKVLAKNPELKAMDVVRTITKQWESAEESLKNRLQEEYKRDQQIYAEVRTKYDSKITDEQRAEIKQLKQEAADNKERKQMRKRVKELGRPRKPMSAFLRFVAAERTSTPQLGEQTYREWHRKATEKWARLSPEEKEPYMNDARKELEKHKKEMSVWEEKMIRLGNIDVVRHSNLIDPPEPKPKKR